MTVRILPVAAGLFATACATVPTGPSVMVLPGTGKSFEQFQTDDAICRRWASQQIGTTTQNGAGSGEAGAPAQRRYDMTYMQCMYVKGNQIPVARGSQQPYTSQEDAPQAAPANVPPPPTGTPPAPPPASSR